MDKLRQLRKNQNKTQQQIADFLGVSQQAYAAYENETRMPPLDIVSKLADYFEVTVDYLLGRTDSPTSTLAPEAQEMSFAFYNGIKADGLSEEQVNAVNSFIELLKQKGKI